MMLTEVARRANEVSILFILLSRKGTSWFQFMISVFSVVNNYKKLKEILTYSDISL